MADNSGIQWTDATWNPTRGCRRVSPGCGGSSKEGGCYAERQAYRFSGPGMPYEGLVKLGANGPRWTGETRIAVDLLDQPIRWRTPRRIFVDSMSDLFYEGFRDDQIDRVLAVMLLTPRHTFQVLTKRAQRMREYLTDPTLYERVLRVADVIRAQHRGLSQVAISNPSTFPARWIWFGVSVEDQRRADERIPELLRTPAAVRFLSVEPQLEALSIADISVKTARGWSVLKPLVGLTWEPTGKGTVTVFGPKGPRIDWVICGGESGPGARPFDLAWARSLRDQCKAADVAFFLKQLGEDPIDGLAGCSVPFRARKGDDPAEWTADLRVRQFPEVRHGA